MTRVTAQQKVQAVANARLIAAAPQMLDALRFVYTEFSQFLNDDAHSRRVRDRIVAAIKAASDD